MIPTQVQYVGQSQILVLVFNPGLPDAMAQLRVGLMIALRRKSLMHDQIVLFVDDLGESLSPPKVWTVRDFPPMLADCGLKEVVHARDALAQYRAEHGETSQGDSFELALACALRKPQSGYPGRSVVIPESARESVQNLRRTMNELEAGSSRGLREIVVYDPDGPFHVLP